MKLEHVKQALFKGAMGATYSDEGVTLLVWVNGEPRARKFTYKNGALQ